MVLTRENIAAVLKTGDFAVFVGQLESECFDAKAQPYAVDSDAGKRELARDASAFANGRGGYILLGLKTTQSTLHYADEVEAVRPLPQGLVNTVQVRDIIKEWLYPAIDGLSVQFYSSRGDTGKGIVAIHVPEQRTELKPFLIVRSFDGTRYVETMFGYAERKGDVNSPLTVADLQRALRSGLHFEEQLTTRLDRIEALVAARETSLTTSSPDEALRVLDERIQRALGGGGGPNGA